MDTVMVETSLSAGDRRFLRVYSDKDGRQYVRTGKGGRVKKYLDTMAAKRTAGNLTVYSVSV